MPRLPSMSGSDEGDDVVLGQSCDLLDSGLDFLMGEEAFAQGTVEAVSRRRDGNGLVGAGGMQEACGRGLVVPDFGMPVAPTDDDAGEGGLLEGEAEVLAVAGFDGAVAAQAGRDLVISQGYLGADDAAVI